MQSSVLHHLLGQKMLSRIYDLELEQCDISNYLVSFETSQSVLGFIALEIIGETADLTAHHQKFTKNLYKVNKALKVIGSHMLYTCTIRESLVEGIHVIVKGAQLP